MASTIRIKRSGVAGNPAVLAAGELAYSSLTDNGSNGGDRLYVGTGTETAGNAANHVVIGGKVFTDAVTDATNANTASAIVRRDASGNFSANTITASLTGNASTATSAAALTTGRTIAITGDLAYTSPLFDGSTNITAAGTLATVNSNVGAFGGATSVPIITVNAKGLITAVSTATITSTPSLSIAGGTGTDSVVVGTDTLTFAGGTGVATTVTNNQVSFAIGQAVDTTSNVTFNDVTVNGTLNSDDITATNITVAGNLTVTGTTTTVNSTAISVSDINITVAKDATTAAQANGAGLTVVGPTTPATFTYTSADDRWNLNKNLNVNTVFGALSGNASTATALATARTISISGDLTYTSPTFDGSGNVTAAGTLATVNSNVGSFGSSTSVPSFTVNAKGLITAAGSNAIPTATSSVLGLASFNATEFSVATGAVSILAVDGGTY
jgi:hypothetical protein